MTISAREQSTKAIQLSYILVPKRQRKHVLSAVQGCMHYMIVVSLEMSDEPQSLHVTIVLLFLVLRLIHCMSILHVLRLNIVHSPMQLFPHYMGS